MDRTSNAKQTAIEVIQRMPEDATLEQIQYELYFRQRVDRGLRELAAGRTVSHESVKRSVRRWLKSAGR